MRIQPMFVEVTVKETLAVLQINKSLYSEASEKIGREQESSRVAREGTYKVLDK